MTPWRGDDGAINFVPAEQLPAFVADAALAVPAAWWQPGSDRFDDLKAGEPVAQPTMTAPRKKITRRSKPAPGQSSFSTTEEAPSDGKYDDNRKSGKRR